MARISTQVLGLAFLALLIGTAIAESYDKREAEAYAVQLSVIGSKVPRGLMTSWFSKFQTATHGMVQTKPYGELPSGEAKGLFKSVNMIISDIPLTPEESSDIQSTLQSAVAHIPLAVAGIAITYHKNSIGVSNLKLSPTLLAKIFNGDITNWNHADILAENPGSTFPTDLPVVPVIIDDNAGTTFTMNRYLYEFANDFWHTLPSYTMTTTSTTAKRVTVYDDAITAVTTTAGAIAYISFADASISSIPTAAIKNPSGAYVLPSLTSLTAAANNPTVALPSDGVNFWSDKHLLGSPAASAYPISFYAFAIFLTEMQSAGPNGPALGAFILWSQTGEAQNSTTASFFSPLPSSVITLNRDVTMKNAHYAPGTDTTDYWPYIAPVAPTPSVPAPVAAPVLTLVPTNGLQITIIIVLVILIILVIGYDQYRGGCIIKCNSTGRGIWA